ncbi:hypothetical protein WJX74_008739 [Apatococcus lobatus]|uniref:ABM domain-containing protein n=1 Tax=Apatococcus lobatus TaxID=904363 RepID=A0AAW1R3M4_9CHLO
MSFTKVLLISAVVSTFAIQIEATSRLADFASSARDVFQGITTAVPRHDQIAAQANGKAYPLIEFKVPPQHEKEFVNLFRTVHEIVAEQEPEVKYSLSRQSDGNLIWYIYGEFASVEDYNKHASQQYEHDFYNGINELGIVWESHLLQPVLG